MQVQLKSVCTVDNLFTLQPIISFDGRISKMINAVVYSRASMVKLIRIPHPKFNRKSMFGSDFGYFSSGLVGTVASTVRDIIETLKYVVAKYFCAASCNQQWVIVRVHSAGVNPVDAKFLYGDKLPHFLISFFRLFIEKRVCGIDFSGEITSAPPNCEYEVGDEVFGTMAYPAYGSFAEYARARTDSISLKPRNITHAQASVLPLVGLTALQAMKENNLRPGMHVLIIGGSGGTGHIAVQLAKLKGVKVTAVCSLQNAPFVKALGADNVINYDKTDNIVEDFARVVESIGMFDMVFDSVSSADARDALYHYEDSIRNSSHPLMVKGSEGRYIRLSGSPTDWLLAHIKRFLGLSIFQRNHGLFWVRFGNSSEELEELCSYVESEKMMPVISMHLPFTQAGVQKAFIYQLNRRTVGKMVIDIIPDAPDDDAIRKFGSLEAGQVEEKCIF